MMKNSEWVADPLYARRAFLRKSIAIGSVVGLSALPPWVRMVSQAAQSSGTVGNPVWFDDYLGAAIDGRYAIGSVGGGSTVIAPDMRNGAALLSSTTNLLSHTRMRLGGDPGTGDPVDARNWHVNHDIFYETRVFFNTTNYLQSSIGFVGLNDPNNFLEFYYHAPSSSSGTWTLAITSNTPNGTFINTGFTHPQSQWVVFRIETTRGTPATVRGYINGSLVATYTGTQIPTTNLVPEYNIYNFAQGNQYSLVGLWVDYLYVTQSRT